MSLRKIPLVEGEYYHIYNRGNSKQKIFLDDEDYDRFAKLLYLCNSTRRINFKEDIIQNKINAWDFDRGERLVSVGAWVAMPNHFHLYITPLPKSDFGEKRASSITEFMRKLGTAYSKYFNKKYSRTGSLFEGKFKSVHISNEVQSKYLFSYIHLNPLKLIQKDWKENGINDKNKALDFLNNYKWGSYNDYLDPKRKEGIILNREGLPNYFNDASVFKREIFDWLKSTEVGLR